MRLFQLLLTVSLTCMLVVRSQKPNLILFDIYGDTEIICIDYDDSKTCSDGEEFCKINNAGNFKLENVESVSFGFHSADNKFTILKQSDQSKHLTDFLRLAECKFDTSNKFFNPPEKNVYILADYPGDPDEICLDKNFDLDCDAGDTKLCQFKIGELIFKSGQIINVNNDKGVLAVQPKKTVPAAFSKKVCSWAGNKFTHNRIVL